VGHYDVSRYLKQFCYVNSKGLLRGLMRSWNSSFNVISTLFILTGIVLEGIPKALRKVFEHVIFMGLI